MLQEVHERFRRPLFIAETGIEDNARPAWLRYVGQEVRRARHAGVPIHGLCLYPIVNHPGWDDERHCRNGLWDYVDALGRRKIYAPLAAELKAQQRLLNAAPSSDSGADTVEGADARLLDTAAQWMEIRSGREDILPK
jgi:hypothetical protein